MKLLKPFLLLLAFSTLLCSSMKCKKDNIDAQEPTLPAETQTGAETFGCLVDGKVFVPKGNFTTPGLSAVVQLDILSLGASKSSTGESVSFGIRNLTTVNDYNLVFPNTGTYFLISAQYDAVDGKVTITKYDKTNKVISGRFYFTGKNISNGKTVNVTEGRFDVKYTN